MTRLSLRRLGGLALATIAWLAAACGCAAPDPPALIGTVVLAEGEVSVRRPNSDKWEPAKLGQDLYWGDTVRTGPASRAVILSHDERQVKLNERDRLLLKSSPSSRREIWPKEERRNDFHAKLTSIHGQVTVFRGGGFLRGSSDRWKPAQLNQELHAGDLVRTGPASRATITHYPEETRIQLDEAEILIMQRGPGQGYYSLGKETCGAIDWIHGEVTVNGKPARLGQRLVDGNVVSIGPASWAIVQFAGDLDYSRPDYLSLEENSEEEIPKIPTVTRVPRG